MKHTQNEEQIRELLDALTEMTRLYKTHNESAAKPLRKKLRALKRLRKGGFRSLLGYARRKLRKPSVQDASAPAYDYFSDEKIAVYTALFGKYDTVREPVCRPDNIDYYILTDQEMDADSSWRPLDFRALIPEPYAGDPVMANRWCKLHPHELFPDYEYSIYVDSNYLITSDLTALVNRMADFPAALFRHKDRSCVYDEIDRCIEIQKDKKDRLLAHREALLKKGLPEQYGLLEAPVIVRKHHDEACVRLMDVWWNNFCNGCRRDQVALPEALWDLGIPTDTLATLGDDFRKCNLFVTFPHN